MPPGPTSPRLEYPPLGKPYLLGFDQDNSAYPIIAVHLDPRVGLGQTPPVLGSACPYQGYSALVFVGQKTVEEGTRVMRTYRILPGAWTAPKEVPDIDGAIVTTVSRDNIGANIVAADVLAGSVNTVTSAEPVDAFVSKEIVTSRAIDGPSFTTPSFSDRGDAITIGLRFVNPAENPPAKSYGIDVKQEPGTLHKAKRVVTTTAVFGWTYSSHVDPQTGIVGNVAKTFVASNQSNTSGIYIGPETVNGKTFGASGDLVIVEYEDDDDITMQALMVTVFSLLQINGIVIGPFPIEGGYPIPPVLQALTPFADFAVASGTGSGTGSNSNWDYHYSFSIEADIGKAFYHYPEKLIGTEKILFFIGAPNLTTLGITPTQLFATSGDCVTRTLRQEEGANAWANETAEGQASSNSLAYGYKVSEIPPCLNGSVEIPGTFGGGSLQGSGTIFKPDTSTLPDTIVEVEVSEMKYTQLFELRLIKWTVPTPPA